MAPIERRVFVYGTLMEGFYNHDRLLQGEVVSRERARVRGGLYHLAARGYPALVAGDGWVTGELIALRDFAAALARLDELEGYYGPEHAEDEYERIEVPCYPLAGGGPETAYAYRYARPFGPELRAQAVGSGDWRGHMGGKPL